MTDLSGWRPGDRILGTKAKGQKYKCGGWTECDVLHEFLDPADVVVLNEAVPLIDFRDTEHGWRQDLEDAAVANQTLYIGKVHVVPTLLGLWYENTSVN